MSILDNENSIMEEIPLHTYRVDTRLVALENAMDRIEQKIELVKENVTQEVVTPDGTIKDSIAFIKSKLDYLEVELNRIKYETNSKR